MTTPGQAGPHTSRVLDRPVHATSARTVGTGSHATPTVGTAPPDGGSGPPDRATIERSRRLRGRSQELRLAASRARARARAEGRRCPYACVLGTRNGSAIHLVVRQDGTVVGISAPSDAEPLRATLTAARTCDRVTAISFIRAGRRPGIPLVEAVASLDGWADVPRELQQRIAEGLRGKVIRPLFAVGLRASALRGRTTDSFMRQELDEIVTTLDEVIANMRRAVLHPPHLASHDGPSAMSDRDLDTNARVVRELHAVGIAVQRLYRRSDDPSVQEQLLRIVDRLGDAVSELRSMLFERPERRPRPGAADGWVTASVPLVHPESRRQHGRMSVDRDDLTPDA